MEEKEKLERGEIVEKKPAGSSPSERTPTTAEAQQPPETEGQELTAESCEAKLQEALQNTDAQLQAHLCGLLHSHWPRIIVLCAEDCD